MPLLWAGRQATPFHLGDQDHEILRITRSEVGRAGHLAGSASDSATDPEHRQPESLGTRRRHPACLMRDLLLHERIQMARRAAFRRPLPQILPGVISAAY